MPDVFVGAPYTKVEFATETGALTIAQQQQMTDSNMDFDIYSVTTDRDVGADDCPTFTVVLAYKEKWYKQIGPNDLVIINLGRGEEAKPVMFGMVDNIRKTWSFANLKPVRTITITGRGFNKAFIQFGIGAVTEISGTQYKSAGFFHGQDLGFSEASPAELIKTTIDYYIDKGININFANDKSLNDYVNTIYMESADEDETLGNVQNYYSYQGGLWEYLKELRNAPFYEMFWEVTDDKPTLVVRPTPFNPTEWTNLQMVNIDEREIVNEELGRSDLETYTVYSVKAETIFAELDQSYGLPIWYKPFYEKYGLRRLQVQSKYIPVGEKSMLVEEGGAHDTVEDDDFEVNTLADNEKKLEEIREREERRKEFVEKKTEEKQSQAEKDIEDAQRASDLIDSVGGRFGLDTSDKQEDIMSQAEEKAESEMAELEAELERGSQDNSVSKKTVNLFNWNIHNNNFENGTIVLRGNNQYKVGTRARREEDDMEYYIEHVNHSFVYNEQWTTTIEVTRGMEYGTRFKSPWNDWEVMTIEDLSEISGFPEEELIKNSAPAGPLGTTGIFMGTTTEFQNRLIRSMQNHAGEIYSQDYRNQPGYSDCSSFIYRVVKEARGEPWQGTGNAPVTGDWHKYPHLWQKTNLRPTQAQPGDILWRPGHVEFVGPDGKKTYGAFHEGKRSGQGYQVRDGDWTMVYRPVMPTGGGNHGR